MIIDKEQLLNFAIAKKSLHEINAQTRYFTESTPSVFLSHKHTDIVFVERIKNLFENLHHSVYVDWQDPDMHHATNADTANNIKDKIQKCKKFVFVATNEAIDSKWCNWEIGFADAKKFVSQMAIFPVKDINRSWLGSEYLQLYPRIEYIKHKEYHYTQSGEDVPEGFYVLYPNQNTIPLSTWLNN